MRDLTPKQKNVLAFLYRRILKDRRPPTVREIASHFGFSSTGTVRDYLNALAAKGYLRLGRRCSRGIELVKEKILSLPLLGRITAGSPVLAVEDIEGVLNLESLIFSEDEVFALRVEGDSMVGAGILPGDYVIVKRQPMAGVGEIVVALLRDEATVKYLDKTNGTYWLKPANPAYEPRQVDDQVTILGKVVSVIRRV